MAMVHAQDQAGAPQASAVEHLTVGAVRWSLHGPRRCAATPRSVPPFVADLQTVGVLFREAQATMLGVQGAGLLVGCPGVLALTRHERRLLRAAAAAQADDDRLVDNYLFKLAPHAEARPALTRAVSVLATSLALAGHWLPALPVPESVPPVARPRVACHARRLAS